MALPTPRTIQRTYLVLTTVTTLATSFIWGVNTLFLLDAGLSNTEAFAANAFYAIGQVLFEVPTGVVADTRGRRFSYMLGAATLLASTVLYLLMWQVHAPFVGWALASALLGLGFTFFSGATEAWLVDALGATGFSGELDTVFGRAQTASGAAMLLGSVLGGVVAQADRSRRPVHPSCGIPRGSRWSSPTATCMTSASRRGAAPIPSRRSGTSCAARSTPAGATRRSAP